MVQKRGGPMTVTEAGRIFERIGRKGGQKVADLIERAKRLEEEMPMTESEREQPV